MTRSSLLPSILACASALFGLSAAAETFTYGSGVPERSSANIKGVNPLLDKITAATQNRVTFTRLMGGTVVQIPTGLQGVRDGIVDSGFTIMQAHPANLPVASLIADLGGLGTDTYATFGAINEFMFVHCPGCLADFKKQGVVPLLTQSATPLTMACTRPATTAAELKGLRAVALGAPELRWAARLGMTPARTTFAEVLQQLQLGNADCFVAPVSWIKSYGLQDVIKSVIEMPQGVVSGALPLFFNQKSWARISEADRHAMLRLMPEANFRYVHDAYVEFDVEAKKEYQSRIRFVPGDKAMAEAWAQ
ncbi:MAG: hypothetical protein ACREVR_18880, partial [Burkholderiales bacterium]